MSETKQTPVSTTRKSITLKEFINENDKLLTAIGVMGALAAFFTTVNNGEYLAFLSFAMLLVLYSELYKSLFRVKNSEGTMYLFQYISMGFPVVVGIFMAETYTNYFKTYFLPLIITVAFSSLIPVLKRKFSRKTSLIIYTVVIIIFILAYLYVILPLLPSKL